MRTTREYSVGVGNAELAVVEWSGSSDPVLLLHATGFHSRCWDEVVKRLPGYHVYAVDLRFHGRSSHGETAGELCWQLLADDIRILIERLDLNHLVGVGHSIGGHLIASVAASIGQRFKQLLLIDPVILSPETYADLHRLAGQIEARDHPVSRRKNRWMDADEMFERFRTKAPFDSWQPQVLRDYCDHALQPAAEQGVMQLACDPLNEASIYLSQSGNEVIFSALPRLTTPVTLLRAPPAEGPAMDLSSSPTWPGLAAALPCSREIYLPTFNHFIPMQDPALVARYIEEAQANTWHRSA
jgi:pimeloyl-ACP methyl ester carboxylesterase